MTVIDNPSHPAWGRTGVTLIEVMVSMVLVTTVLLISVTASANLLRSEVESQNHNLADELADQILDEISAMEFRDPVNPVYGLEADELASSRVTFDDVDDYHRYVSRPPVHRDGSPIAGYEGWSFSVTVWPCNPETSGITTRDATESSALRAIIVTCTSPAGVTSSLSTLVSNVPNDVGSGSSYQRWRRLQLRFPDARQIDVTVPLRNHPETPTP